MARAGCRIFRAVLIPGALALALAACASAAERTVEVDFPAEAVAGLPVPVRLVVHGKAEVAPPRLMGRVNPYPITLTAGDLAYEFPARRYFVHRPPRRNYHVPVPETLRLPVRQTVVDDGKSCEFALDLGHLDGAAAGTDPRDAPLGLELVQPGEYALEMTDPVMTFEYRRPTIRFVEPNPEERYLLRNLARAESDEPRWQVFVEQYERVMQGVDPGRLSELGRRQMRYVMLLAKLVHSEKPIAELTIGEDDMADLPGGHGTECLILRYEIETARKDAPAALATREAILAVRPNAEMLLGYVEKQGGLIASFREDVGSPERASGPPGGAGRGPSRR